MTIFTIKLDKWKETVNRAKKSIENEENQDNSDLSVMELAKLAEEMKSMGEKFEEIKNQLSRRTKAHKEKEIQRKKEKEAREEEERKRKAEEAEKKRLAEEQKKRLAEEKKRMAAEEAEKKRLAEEQKKIKAIERRKLLAENRKRAIAEKKKLDEERKKVAAAKKKLREEKAKKVAEEKELARTEALKKKKVELAKKTLEIKENDMKISEQPEFIFCGSEIVEVAEIESSPMKVAVSKNKPGKQKNQKILEIAKKRQEIEKKKILAKISEEQKLSKKIREDDGRRKQELREQRLKEMEQEIPKKMKRTTIQLPKKRKRVAMPPPARSSKQDLEKKKGDLNSKTTLSSSNSEDKKTQIPEKNQNYEENQIPEKNQNYEENQIPEKNQNSEENQITKKNQITEENQNSDDKKDRPLKNKNVLGSKTNKPGAFHEKQKNIHPIQENVIEKENIEPIQNLKNHKDTLQSILKPKMNESLNEFNSRVAQNKESIEMLFSEGPKDGFSRQMVNPPVQIQQKRPMMPESKLAFIRAFNKRKNEFTTRKIEESVLLRESMINQSINLDAKPFTDNNLTIVNQPAKFPDMTSDFYKREIDRKLANFNVKKNIFSPNDFSPQTKIPLFTTSNETEFKKNYQKANWVKSNDLVQKLENQNHFEIKKYFDTPDIDIVSMFPTARNVTNDSPNKMK